MKTSRAGGFFCNKNYLCTPVRQGDPVVKPSARRQATFIRPSSPAAQWVLNHLFSPIYLSICRIDLLSCHQGLLVHAHTRMAPFFSFLSNVQSDDHKLQRLFLFFCFCQDCSTFKICLSRGVWVTCAQYASL